MAVVVVNVSKKHGKVYGTGLQHYELRLNEWIIAEFTHTFEDGMGECLRKASVAADSDEGKKNLKALDDLRKGPSIDGLIEALAALGKTSA